MIKITKKEAWVMAIAAITMLVVVITATSCECAHRRTKDCCDMDRSKTMKMDSSSHQS
ncbi:hypothetical protein G6R29_05215 [Fructobacillus sp. M2-14]|uniref:Uncharacterized protein n=1 Tax=Fructobacillus broussonetiae TaxID=2713173 RepID=A0ABS5R0P6_9LACO|nr:hypothetical protein [Fructobacillus broussonetiae]MBS9339019.1 hypothetical protein [Fructobacillus broussonetiae]